MTATKAGEIAIAALEQLNALTTTSAANWKEASFRRKVRLVINEATREIGACRFVNDEKSE